MSEAKEQSGWRVGTLGDLLEEHGERCGAQTLPVLSITKARGMVYAADRFSKALHSKDLSRYRVSRRDQFVIDPMLLWDGQIARQKIVDAGLVSPDYRVFVVRDGHDPGYLEYVVRSPEMREHYKLSARGTNVRRSRISRSDFLELKVNIPPIAEQRKIAAILGSVDTTIEATQAVIEQLQVVKKAMMAELLTRGIPGHHKRFKRTEIGECPEEWTVVSLGSIIEGGPDNGLYRPQTDYGTGTKIVRIDDFDNGEVLSVKELRRVRVPDSEIQKFSLRRGDILINRVNSLSHIAKAALIEEIDEPVLFESNMMRVHVSEDKIISRFAFLSITAPEARAFFKSRAKQAIAQASVNQQDVRALAIRLPSMKEQELISNAIDSVSSRFDAELEKLQCLQSLKSALMSVLLTGEVRVTADGVSVGGQAAGGAAPAR